MAVVEQFVRAGDGARLCVETFGSPTDPAILLIGGAASAMDYWEDGFCAALAAGGRHVVRYDHRDTGRSQTWPVGRPGYTFVELVDDPVAVLDGLGLAAAHVVGLSMGGGIAQTVALTRPERLITLTLMSTSPGEGDLPPMRADIAAAFSEPEPAPDPSDRAAVIDRAVADLRMYTGTLPFDAAHARALVAGIHERSTDVAAADNHWMVIGGEGGPQLPPIETIRTPTLVLHGTDDPLFPLGHGEALAARIPGARLVPLPGVGHEYPPAPVWPLVVDELLAHSGGAVEVATARV